METIIERSKFDPAGDKNYFQLIVTNCLVTEMLKRIKGPDKNPAWFKSNIL
jgi:hypothetical protein